jgi:hypothetical protein
MNKVEVDMLKKIAVSSGAAVTTYINYDYGENEVVLFENMEALVKFVNNIINGANNLNKITI